MGLFSRRKLNNTAAGVLPPGARPILPPGQTTIHNHSTGWAAIIAVAFGCFLLSLPVLWGILVFLFGEMGYTKPGREAAFWIVFIPFIVLAVWLVKWLILAVMDSLFAFRLEVQKEITERARLELQAAQVSLPAGRMNEDDYNFARVVLAVMMVAYGWQEKNERTKFPGKWRPWSMRSALEAANGIGVKLSHDQANAVSVWLHDKGVITSPESGQITARYPDLASVRVMIDREFGRPIQVMLSPTSDNSGYVPIISNR